MAPEQKVSREFADVEGDGQDLHHLQQDLDRFGQALSILVDRFGQAVSSLVDRNKRFVEGLIEEQRLLRKRNKDLEDLVESLYQSQSSQTKATVEDVKARDIVDDMVISSATTEEESDDEESEDDEETDDDSDTDTAKILIDLCAQEQIGPNSGQLFVKTQFPDVDLGCRFQPTDQELIMILKKKIAGGNIPIYITERNLYGSDEPGTIFKGNPAGELYFVTQIKKKFDSGKKNSRVVGNGTWKIQNNKKVYENRLDKNKVIGEKRTLNFIDENTKKDKISWIMHEYNLCSAAENPERWAICRIKRGKGKRVGLDSPPRPIQIANDDNLRDANDQDLRLSKKRPALEIANDEDCQRKGNRIGLDLPPRPIWNANDDDSRLPKKRCMLETIHNANNDEVGNAHDDDLRLLKKSRELETMDLSLSLGRPSENMTEAPRKVQKDQEQNLFEHSLSSPPWGTFL